MTATNHALTGAAIALYIKQPAMAIPMAFLSHFILDAIPHFGVPPGTFKLNRYFKFLVADFLMLGAVVILFVFLFTEKFWMVFLCMFVAASPDISWWRYRHHIERNDKQGVDIVNRFHWWIQWKEFPKGIIVEINWFALMFFLVLSQGI